MTTFNQLLNSADFDGSISLCYAAYQRSYKHQYQQVDRIKLLGDSREVRIMTNWISKHFPDIPLTSDVAIDDVDYVNRAAIETQGEQRLNAYDKFRYDEFWRISSSLSCIAQFSNLFDVDHANSIAEHGIDAIHPDNLNIMLFRANRKKSYKSAPRYTWDRQQEVIWSSIKAVKQLASDEELVVSQLLTQLKALY
ncbi:hypothetical protein [Shewanella maritima]|uniref:hypothetical protein n=1 Tax=Shewanella maritima TaxID=2520507 RepID=UPI0037356AFF